MNTLQQLNTELQRLASPERAKVTAQFFKTGPGEYGEGDQFLGITVPELRRTAKDYSQLSFEELSELLDSPWHEKRMLSLIVLTNHFKKTSQPKEKKAIYDFYVAHFHCINNWDLVDISAHHIVGAYLFNRSHAVLSKWARSDDLWVRRIAIVSTWYFIRQNNFETTLKTANMLLKDKEDLLQKAAGWMLREVGKRDESVLESFLRQHYQIMPRTMLRYAIERLAAAKRKAYLKGTIEEVT